MAIHDTNNTGGTFTSTETGTASEKHQHNHFQERLNSALLKKTPTNRSADLVPLKQDFETLRGNLLHVIKSAKKYDESLETTDKARMETAGIMGDLFRDSPFDGVAKKDTSIHQRLSNKNKEMKMRYRITVIEHLEQLHSSLSLRVDQEEKEVDKLRKILTHYQDKVEKLREKVHTKEINSKKEVSPRKASKLERNEGKLGKAWRMHEAKSSRLCDLLEEVTKNGWKDLYKIVSSMMSFEKDLGEQNYEITKEFSTLSSEVDEIYKNDMDSMGHDVPIALKDPQAKHHAVATDIYADDESSIASSTSSSSKASATAVVVHTEKVDLANTNNRKDI